MLILSPDSRDLSRGELVPPLWEQAVGEPDGGRGLGGTRERDPLRCLTDLQCASCSARSSRLLAEGKLSIEVPISECDIE